MGGHLTHGSPVNLSGKLYRVVSYGLTAKEEIDYDAAERIAMAEKPKLIVTGASAYSLAIDWKRFRAIADKCGALLMADIAHYAGLIAAGLYPSPDRHRGLRHHHHPQDAARPARRHDFRQARAGEADQFSRSSPACRAGR